MIPCPKCFNETVTTRTTKTFEKEEPIVIRRHRCKDCDYTFVSEMRPQHIPSVQETNKLIWRVKAQLKAQGLTQKQFAELLNKEYWTVKAWFQSPGTRGYIKLPKKYHEGLRNFCIDGIIFTKNRG